MRVVNQKDFVTGIFYAALGGATAIGAAQYDLGSASAMGPGYFPLLAGCALLVLGLIVAGGAVRAASERTTLDAGPLAWIVIVLAALLLFAATFETLGLFIAIPLLVGVASMAHPDHSWRMTLLVIAILLPLVWLIFIAFLGLGFPLLPDFV